MSPALRVATSSRTRPDHVGQLIMTDIGTPSTAVPRYLSVDAFVGRIGAEEADQLVGSGLRDNRVLDIALVAAQLVHADGVIDGYVRARYPRRFVVVPEVLAGIAHDIARYRLRAKGGQQSAMSEAVQKQYDEAMRLLRDIAEGRLTLDVDGDDSQPEPGTAALNMGGAMPPARMGRMLEGWR